MFDMLDKPEKGTSAARRFFEAMSHNNWVAVTFAIITIWVLISDDLRLACMPPSADTPMAMMAMVFMAAFILEIVMYCFGTRHYFWSFFFWLDVLATATMILDIPAVKNAILGGDSNSESLKSTTLARATRMSRIGTKAGRIASVRFCLCVSPGMRVRMLVAHRH